MRQDFQADALKKICKHALKEVVLTVAGSESATPLA